ncbi:IMV nonessential membrane protein [Equine molluscum contagiosum-like virus]|nr:IMV nonessential membrane protein [Equine molluscum contagiosum-like virus]
MVTSYEPLLLLGFICLSVVGNRAFSRGTKIDLVFSIHSVFFLWFLYHFLYSVF